MDEVEPDPRPETIARQRAESVGLSWDDQPDWWRRSKIEQHARDLVAADLVDPLRQCKVPAGRPTTLVHKSLFDSVLTQRDQARAELLALKAALRDLGQS